MAKGEYIMKVIYDTSTDTLSFILQDVPVIESDELREGLIIDYAEDGKIVSNELLDAAVNAAEPEGIHYELKGAEAANL